MFGAGARRRAPVLALALVLPLAATRAFGQPPLETKQPFVAGLIELLGAVSGTYGDEGPRLSASVDRMAAGLQQWDAAVRGYAATMQSRTTGAAAPVAAGLHVAVGAVMLERGWLPAAADQFTAARTLDPRRPDVPMLLGLADELANSPQRAATAFRTAWTLDPTDPVLAYRYLRHAASSETAERARARDDLLAFLAHQGPDGAARAAPFVAVRLLDEPQTREPVFPPAAYAEAFEALAGRRYEDAVAAFRAAVRVDPLVADPAIAELAIAQAVAALRDGRTSEAIERLDAVARRDDSAEVHRMLGVAYWFAGQNAQSIESLAAAVRRNPMDERARMTMADVLVEDRQLARAEQLLLETVELMPRSGQAQFRLGKLYQLGRRDREARVAFERAAGCHPVAGAFQLYATIARLYAAAPDLDAAVAWEERRVELDLNDPAAHEALGDAYRKRNRDEDALAEFVVAAALDRSDEDAYVSIGQILVAAGRYADGSVVLRRAVALAPGRFEPRFLLGTALVRAGDEDEGRAQLEIARGLQTEELESRRQTYALTGLKIEAARQTEQGRPEDAAAGWQQVVEREPTAANYVSLGRSLAEAGRHEAAVQAFAHAAGLASDPEVHRLLAGEYAALGRTGDSARERAEYQRLSEEQLRRLGTVQ